MVEWGGQTSLCVWFNGGGSNSWGDKPNVTDWLTDWHMCSFINIDYKTDEVNSGYEGIYKIAMQFIQLLLLNKLC